MGSAGSFEVFENGELEDDFKKAGGVGDMSIWELFKRGYDDLVNAIIRPSRAQYTIADLGPTEFRLKETQIHVVRTDFDVTNESGLNLVCSHWVLRKDCRQAEKLPCVIYLHSNIGSRVDALRIRDEALSMGFSVLAFDFSGSGKSDGEYVTVGYKEKDDVKTMCEYASNLDHVSAICLWGHSLGAGAALMHSARTNDSGKLPVQAMILDGSFSTLRELATELMETVRQEGFTTPLWVLQAGAHLIRSTVQSRAGFDMYDVRPIDGAERCTMPALFLSGRNDMYVRQHHCIDIIGKYAGKADRLLFDSDHYGRRPKGVIVFALVFLKEALLMGAAEKLSTWPIQVVVPPEELISGPWNEHSEFERVLTTLRRGSHTEEHEDNLAAKPNIEKEDTQHD